MWSFYEVGVSIGMGVAIGMLLGGILAPRQYGIVAATAGVVGIGVGAGLLVDAWLDIPGGIIGGLLGAFAASVVVRGALRRGATLGATAMILIGGAIMVALFSIVPLFGYAAAIGAPIIAIRKMRSEPERYAGLRTLAK